MLDAVRGKGMAAVSGRARRLRFHALAAAFAVLLVCQSFMMLDVLADIFYVDLYIP